MTSPNGLSEVRVPASRSLALLESEDDIDVRRKYRPFLLNDDRDWVSKLELTTVLDLAEKDLRQTNSRLKVLVLYGSLRRRSYSRLVAFEASRILFRLGCDVRVFNPEGLPMKNDTDHTHPKVQELRGLSAWSDGHVWVSPEQHGNLVRKSPSLISVTTGLALTLAKQTAVFKNQIDWIPLSTGSIRPTQGRTLAIGQVCGGSQSFNAVNTLRILGRWMRMFTIPNQSSIPQAYTHFPEQGEPGDQRLRASSNRDRLVDCMEEFVKYTILMRPHKDVFGDRFSEREERRLKEARNAAEDLARVRCNQRKSRERRKQRVIELEQRVRQLEEAVALAPTPSLEAENHVLKELLESVGFDRESLEWYLHGTASVGGLELQNPVVFYSAVDSPPVLSSVTQFMRTESGLSISADGARNEADQLVPIYTFSSTGPGFSHAIPAPFDFSQRPEILDSEEMPQAAISIQDDSGSGAELATIESLPGILGGLGGENPISTGPVNDETTLCSIAFHLVIQCNRAGRDVFELESKLRYGYRMPATPGEGCRVDNKTLLAVLAELL
ncbi:flavoprotein-like protein [Aspergillus navahoensis]